MRNKLPTCYKLTDFQVLQVNHFFDVTCHTQYTHTQSMSAVQYPCNCFTE